MATRSFLFTTVFFALSTMLALLFGMATGMLRMADILPSCSAAQAAYVVFAIIIAVGIYAGNIVRTRTIIALNAVIGAAWAYGVFVANVDALTWEHLEHFLWMQPFVGLSLHLVVRDFFCGSTPMVTPSTKVAVEDDPTGEAPVATPLPDPPRPPAPPDESPRRASDEEEAWFDIDDPPRAEPTIVPLPERPRSLPLREAPPLRSLSVITRRTEDLSPPVAVVPPPPPFGSKVTLDHITDAPPPRLVSLPTLLPEPIIIEAEEDDRDQPKHSKS